MSVGRVECVGVRIDRRARPQSRVVVGSLPGQIGWQAWDRSNARGVDGRWDSKEGRLTLQFIAYTSHGASYV
jgi:hypothetical protein